jgi:hypothetical protein
VNQHLSWRTVFDLIMCVNLGGFIVHLAVGSVWAAATHAFIGLLAAMVRGHLSE